MIPLSPALFLAAASALVASDRRMPHRPKSKRARLAELDPIARDAHRPHDGVRTAAFISHVGWWSHRRAMGTSAWPFPLDADCDALARIGLDRGVVSVGTPDPGAVYLRWSVPEQRFTRASIVLWALDMPPMYRSGWTYDCHVLEGSAVLSRGRGPVRAALGFHTKVQWARQARVRCSPGLGDCFLSWVDLDRRNETTRVSPTERAA